MKKLGIILGIFIVLAGGAYWVVQSRQKPDDTQAQEYFHNGENFYNDKYYSKALEQYKLAINEDPTFTEPYLKAADIYILKKMYDDASVILENGLGTASSVDLLYHKLGTIYLEQNQIEEAKKAFEGAYGQNPHNWENVIDLVKVYSYNLDEKDKAINALRKLKTDDEEGKVYKQYYLALLSYDDCETASAYVQDGLQINANGLDGQLSEFAQIVQACEENPEDVVTNNTYFGYELIQAEMYNLAIPLLQTVVEENDEYYAAYMYLGVSYLEMDNLEKAVENFEKSTNVDPRQVDPWIFLAQSYTQQNDQKGAIDAYDEALNLEKDNEMVRYDYALTLQHFNLYSQARLQLQELVEQESADTLQYKLELATLDLDYLDKIDEGFELMQTVVEESDTFQQADTTMQAKALDLYGWAYYKKEAYEDALKFLLRSKETYPYYATTYYHLGVVYAQMNNISEANINLERAIDLDIKGDISAKASTEIENLTRKDSDENEDTVDQIEQ